MVAFVIENVHTTFLFLNIKYHNFIKYCSIDLISPRFLPELW